MRRVAIFIILLFALFTLINAYTSERTAGSQGQSTEKTLR
jgi:hypothetical protein